VARVVASQIPAPSARARRITACDSRESSKSICKEIALQRPKTGKFDYLSGPNHPAHSIVFKFFTDDQFSPVCGHGDGVPLVRTSLRLRHPTAPRIIGDVNVAAILSSHHGSAGRVAGDVLPVARAEGWLRGPSDAAIDRKINKIAVGGSNQPGAVHRRGDADPASVTITRDPSHPAIVRSPYATKIGCRKFRSVTRRRDAQPRARLSAPRPTDPAVCRSVDVPESLDRSHICTSQVTGDPPPRPRSGSRLIRPGDAAIVRSLDVEVESNSDELRPVTRGSHPHVTGKQGAGLPRPRRTAVRRSINQLTCRDGDELCTRRVTGDAIPRTNAGSRLLRPAAPGRLAATRSEDRPRCCSRRHRRDITSVTLHYPGATERPQAGRRPVGLVVTDELHVVDIGAGANRPQHDDCNSQKYRSEKGLRITAR